jgi:hypothetical protein
MSEVKTRGIYVATSLGTFCCGVSEDGACTFTAHNADLIGDCGN